MINKDRLIHEFMHLVSFDAESGHEKEICLYLQNKLTKLGLETKVDETGNLYGILPGNTAGREPILLSAHMDTVKPGIGKKAILHDNGTITSDQSTVLGADDAVGLAEILEVLTVIKESSLPHGDIEILFPVAEEIFSKGCQTFDFSMIKSRMAYTLDMSGPVGGVAIAAPSIISFSVRVHGKSSHAGFAPQDGIHAISIAAEALSQMRMGYVEDDTSVNVGTICGGTGKNIVPEQTELTGEIRSMDHEKALQYVQKIRELFENSAKKAGGSISFTCEEHIRSYRIPKDAPVVKAYREACKKAGATPDPRETFGGSDNNRFVEHGISGVVISCAMNRVHTVYEYTHTDEMKKAAKILLYLITA